MIKNILGDIVYEYSGRPGKIESFYLIKDVNSNYRGEIREKETVYAKVKFISNRKKMVPVRWLGIYKRLVSRYPSYSIAYTPLLEKAREIKIWNIQTI